MFDWIWQIAAKKAAAKGVKVFVGVLGGAGATSLLQQFGITVTIDETVLSGAIAGALLGVYELLRNYAKSKGKVLP